MKNRSILDWGAIYDGFTPDLMFQTFPDSPLFNSTLISFNREQRRVFLAHHWNTK